MQPSRSWWHSTYQSTPIEWGRAINATKDFCPLLEGFCLGSGALQTCEGDLTPAQADWLHQANLRSIRDNCQRAVRASLDEDPNGALPHKERVRFMYLRGSIERERP